MVSWGPISDNKTDQWRWIIIIRCVTCDDGPKWMNRKNIVVVASAAGGGPKLWAHLEISGAKIVMMITSFTVYLSIYLWSKHKRIIKAVVENISWTCFQRIYCCVISLIANLISEHCRQTMAFVEPAQNKQRPLQSGIPRLEQVKCFDVKWYDLNHLYSYGVMDSL